MSETGKKNKTNTIEKDELDEQRFKMHEMRKRKLNRMKKREKKR